MSSPGTAARRSAATLSAWAAASAEPRDPILIFTGHFLGLGGALGAVLQRHGSPVGRGCQPSEKLASVSLHQRFRLANLVTPAIHVFIHDALQVVHVVHESVVQPMHGGVDVS